MPSSACKKKVCKFMKRTRAGSVQGKSRGAAGQLILCLPFRARKIAAGSWPRKDGASAKRQAGETSLDLQPRFRVSYRSASTHPSRRTTMADEKATSKISGWIKALL